ncbi:cellulose synthase [Nocardiopsis dassonvillei]|uniref:cellulose synthase n=1 Tax=Nocardiopsis dassonvillei TaxID=2014 RepID=UPI0010D6B8EF|nr:cellulose synthase [Nocardiopsis dassonvillei]MCP3011871.1 cellulose synthase [Nocardiopsis dassonvillei]
MPENLTWMTGLVLGGGLTLAGLVISFFVWRAKGAASGLRGVAWSLLPLAAGLIGLMNAVWQFAMSIFGILVGLLFNPAVWAGVALAGLAVVLYVVSGVMRARDVGTRPGRAKEPKATGGAGGAAGPGAAEPGAAPAAPGAKGKVGPAPKAGAADDLSDLGDIEELLRKRGIE